jgi:DNA repair exonuclease SbcCD ATPase subunit
MDPERPATAVERGSAARPPASQPGDASRRSAETTPVEHDYQAAWRHTLVAVKEALADLEAAANRTPVEPMAAVSSLVERLVAVATAAADAAGQHIRAEARAEVAQTQAIVAQVQAELQREREQLKAASQSLDTERTARGRAEAALTEAREASERSASAYESQIRSLTTDIEASRAKLQTNGAELQTTRSELEANRKEVKAKRAEIDANRTEIDTHRAALEANRAELAQLRQQMETERAERAALITAIKQAIGIGGGGDTTPAAPTPPTTEVEADRVDAAPSEVAEAPAAAAAAPVADGKANRGVQQNPELEAYARELIGKAEAMYRADVAARRSTSELVDRLTSSLRRARLAFARRMGASNLKETTIFEQQLAEVLDTSEETNFIRHLGIAAYESLSKPGL